MLLGIVSAPVVGAGLAVFARGWGTALVGQQSDGYLLNTLRGTEAEDLWSEVSPGLIRYRATFIRNRDAIHVWPVDYTTASFYFDSVRAANFVDIQNATPDRPVPEPVLSPFHGPKRVSMYFYAWGFPCRSFWGWRVNLDPPEYGGAYLLPEFFALKIGIQAKCVPYLPLWPGVIINSLCFFAFWLALLTGVPACRRALRRRRGLCPACAYDLTGNTTGTCPECGIQCRRSARSVFCGIPDRGRFAVLQSLATRGPKPSVS